MALSQKNLEILWALNEQGDLVHIRDAIKGQIYRCNSSNCGGEILVADGGKYQKHFKHKSHGCNLETYEHNLAKHIIAQLINKNEKLELGYKCFYCINTAYKEITTKIKKAKIEESYPDSKFVADVVGYDKNGSKQIFFEVFKTHTVDKLKEDGIKGTHWVEVEADHIIERYEKKLEKKENHTFLVKQHGDCLKPIICEDCKEIDKNRKELIEKFIKRLKDCEKTNEGFFYTRTCKTCCSATEANRISIKVQNATVTPDLERKCDIITLKGKKKDVFYNLVCIYGEYREELKEQLKLDDNIKTLVFKFCDIEQILKNEGDIVLKALNRIHRDIVRCNYCLSIEKQIKYERNLPKRFSLIEQEIIKNKISTDNILEWNANGRREDQMIKDLVYLIDNNFKNDFIGMMLQKYVEEFEQRIYCLFFEESEHTHKILRFVEEKLDRGARGSIWYIFKEVLLKESKYGAIKREWYEKIRSSFWWDSPYQ